MSKGSWVEALLERDVLPQCQALRRYLADVSTGSPAENTAAQAPAAAPATAHTDTGAGESERRSAATAELRKGWVRSSLWPWPALAITVVALAGYLFGWLGAVVAAGQAVASLLFVAGDTLLDLKRRARLAVSAVVVGALVVLVLLWQAHAYEFVRVGESGQSGNSGQTGTPTADLAGRTVTQAMLKGVNLRGAVLSGAALDHLSLTGLSLNGAVAPGSSFIGSDLQDVPMRGAELPGANFTGACLRGADFAGAELNGANITGADITGIDLPSAVRRTLIGKPASAGMNVPSCHEPLAAPSP
jgi:Pentapeptide repeats (8 copies)